MPSLFGLKAMIDLRSEISRSVMELSWRDNKEQFIALTCYAGDKRFVGSKNIFRSMFCFIAERDLEVAKAIIRKIPYLINWGEVVKLIDEIDNEELAIYAALFYATVLRVRKDRLAIKWAPREGKRFQRARKLIMAQLGITRNSEYRKFLAELNKEYDTSLETLMCEGRWEDINYTLISKRAFTLYKNAFIKHDGRRVRLYHHEDSNRRNFLQMEILITKEGYKI
ncbi:hypothetical protein H6G33_09825 [Calothrix sp. FACHB-1219]|uniref:hypothetical protein n=1 Tax=unclassified Calothrix TaxID=2619626 RepID=UPI001684DB79|nr:MULTISPECIES: hypothetical protein [unclassified Calothrix]MBD2201644.1 hypothetical protein [Calothrix sp. FACHB-168]MBD2217330.1 hypothetical protein [Calothrix sp. FACHB-1219]